MKRITIAQTNHASQDTKVKHCKGIKLF